MRDVVCRVTCHGRSGARRSTGLHVERSRSISRSLVLGCPEKLMVVRKLRRWNAYSGSCICASSVSRFLSLSLPLSLSFSLFLAVSLPLFTFNEIAIYLSRCTGRRMMHCSSSIQVAYTQPATSNMDVFLQLSLSLSLTLIEIKLAVSRWPEIFGPFIIENVTWNYVSLRMEEAKRELNPSIVSYEAKAT